MKLCRKSWTTKFFATNLKTKTCIITILICLISNNEAKIAEFRCWNKIDWMINDFRWQIKDHFECSNKFKSGCKKMNKVHCYIDLTESAWTTTSKFPLIVNRFAVMIFSRKKWRFLISGPLMLFKLSLDTSYLVEIVFFCKKIDKIPVEFTWGSFVLLLAN